MKLAWCVIALLCIGVCSFAEELNRPAGTNCDLQTPPNSAGEDMTHGITVRIYPRSKDIGADYSGCQVLFAPDGTSWKVLWLTEVVKGDAVRMWSDDRDDSDGNRCVYQKGHLVSGDTKACADEAALLHGSMAPGCAKILRDAVEREGLSAKPPAECRYQ